jgi:hypothetical protein
VGSWIVQYQSLAIFLLVEDISQCGNGDLSSNRFLLIDVWMYPSINNGEGLQRHGIGDTDSWFG